MSKGTELALHEAEALIREVKIHRGMINGESAFKPDSKPEVTAKPLQKATRSHGW